jgi:hypothetical protein
LVGCLLHLSGLLLLLLLLGPQGILKLTLHNNK